MRAYAKVPPMPPGQNRPPNNLALLLSRVAQGTVFLPDSSAFGKEIWFSFGQKAIL
ncbi:MAG: hypothetical protein J5654_07970 [Victivallales bacterium]|nr:hypothetical protein [Victivallales bacterium]